MPVMRDFSAGAMDLPSRIGCKDQTLVDTRYACLNRQVPCTSVYVQAIGFHCFSWTKKGRSKKAGTPNPVCDPEGLVV